MLIHTLPSTPETLAHSCTLAHTAEKVDVMKLLDLIPPAWEEIAKLDPTGIVGEKGLKSLLTDAMNYRPFREVEFAAQLVDLVNKIPGVDIDPDWNLRKHLNDMIKVLLPPKKNVMVNVGHIINAAVARGITEAGGNINNIPPFLKTAQSMLSSNPNTPDSFAFPKFLRADVLSETFEDGGGRRARRAQRRLNLATQEPPMKTIKLGIPAGHVVPHAKVTGITRRLGGGDEANEDARIGIPGKKFFDGIVMTKEGGACDLTTGDVFPKTITCRLALAVKTPEETGLGSVGVDITAQFQLAYSLDGKALQLIVRQGYKIEMPPLKVSDSLQPMLDMLKKLDLGAMIDRGFTGMISTVPPGLYYPSPILNGEVREVARANLTTVKKEGVCIGNLHRIKPDFESVQDSKSLLGILQAFASLVGGDLCGKIDKVETENGFKTDMLVKASLFDPDKVKVWPVIDVLFDNMPQLAIIKGVVVSVLPRVAGMKNMDEVKALLNELARKSMPGRMTFEIDVGRMLADAYLKAEEAAVKELQSASEKASETTNQVDDGDAGRRRRLAAQRQLEKARAQRRKLNYVLTDGLFDLGFIPASDRFGENPRGRGNPCGEDCEGGYIWGAPPSPSWNNDADEGGRMHPGLLALVVILVLLVVIAVVAGMAYFVVKKRLAQGKDVPYFFAKCYRRCLPLGDDGDNKTKIVPKGQVIQVRQKRDNGTKKKRTPPPPPLPLSKKKSLNTVSRPAPGRSRDGSRSMRLPAPPKKLPAKSKIVIKNSLSEVRRQYGANSPEYEEAVKNFRR